MARLNTDGSGTLIWSQEMLRAQVMLEDCERALLRNPENSVLVEKKEFLAELRRTFHLGFDFDDSQIFELKGIWERH